MTTDPQVEAIVHAQKIARRIGAGAVAIEVYGWAIRNAKYLPNEALQELLDMVTKEPE